MSCAGVPPQSSFMIPEEIEEPFVSDIDVCMDFFFVVVVFVLNHI